MTQTGLPRHAVIFNWPGARLAISSSTGAPAAFARSDGARLAAKGTAAPAAAALPTRLAAAIKKRRLRRSISSRRIRSSRHFVWALLEPPALELEFLAPKRVTHLVLDGAEILFRHDREVFRAAQFALWSESAVANFL